MTHCVKLFFCAKSYKDFLAARKMKVFWWCSLCDVSFGATSGCCSGLMSIGIGCTWKASPLYEPEYAFVQQFSELMRSYNYCICTVSPHCESSHVSWVQLPEMMNSYIVNICRVFLRCVFSCELSDDELESTCNHTRCICKVSFRCVPSNVSSD